LLGLLALALLLDPALPLPLRTTAALSDAARAQATARPATHKQ
jgi:hypothetical protein